MRWTKRLTAIVRERDTEPVELGSAFMAVIWGFWLLAPFHSFGFVPFTLLHDVAREEMWGAGALGLGLAIFSGLTTDSRGERRIGAAGLGVFWATLAGGTAAVTLAPPAWLIYAGLSAAAIWVWWRLRKHDLTE